MPAIKTPQSHFSKEDAGSVRKDEPLALEEKYPKTKEARKKLPATIPEKKDILCAKSNPIIDFVIAYNIKTIANDAPVNPNVCTGLSSNVFLKIHPNLFALNVLFMIVIIIEKSILLLPDFQ
jgi:hypothetical protein